MSDADFTSDADADPAVDNGRKYERSSIAFPYGSLKDAEEIANSLHGKWGDDAEIDQLAAGMKTTSSSGTFRAKLGTARTFGVLEGTRGRARLTTLGKQIVDPKTVAAARVDAFLSVPLFKALYEKHKSGVVPPDEALENEILELGVSSRQTDRARQSFQRSAEQAGFFAHGRDRLIQPNTAKLPQGDDSTRENNADRSDREVKVTDMSDPLIAIWEKLLQESGSMTAEQVKAAVDAARALRDALSG
jgi:hypothetical protein